MRWSVLTPVLGVVILALVPAAAASASDGSQPSSECRQSVDTLPATLDGVPEDASLKQVLDTLQGHSGEACGFDLFDAASDAPPEPEPAGGDTPSSLAETRIKGPDVPADCRGIGAKGWNTLVVSVGGKPFYWEEKAGGLLGRLDPAVPVTWVIGDGALGDGAVVQDLSIASQVKASYEFASSTWHGSGRIAGVYVPLTDVTGDLVCGWLLDAFPPKYRACRGFSEGSLLDLAAMRQLGVNVQLRTDLTTNAPPETVFCPGEG